MKQEIFCYIQDKEDVHFLNVDGSLEVHDILASFVIQIAKLNESTPRDILHAVSGKLQVLMNEKVLV
ncbi:MAG: hypothetical protein COA44_15490 [Arcobacter sp.]|nr:MAG: hypothetical protein COA44_15490 [Arcobacter sp.]